MSKNSFFAILMIAIFSGPIPALAEETASDVSATANSPQDASLSIASKAAAEAARNAAESISADEAVKLDVRLSDLTSMISYVEPITVAAN